MQLIQQQEPTLSTETIQKISLSLSVYADLKASIDTLQQELDERKAEMFKQLTDEGVDKVVIDNIPLTIVRSEMSVLDKETFIRLGGSLKMLDEATVKKPRKVYLNITLGKQST